jgi:hypothetical protein
LGQSLSIYSPSGQVGLPENPFGQRIANLQLYQALARHADFTRLDFLTVREITPEGLAESLFPGETPPVELGGRADPEPAARDPGRRPAARQPDPVGPGLAATPAGGGPGL